jgi:UDP-glucose 4-epimerase
MRVLVVGGAGYIGSHAVNELIKDKQEVIILANLSSG